ncbi:hypothetical protein LguiB_026873 [Lonicera macranthoides]
MIFAKLLHDTPDITVESLENRAAPVKNRAVELAKATENEDEVTRAAKAFYNAFLANKWSSRLKIRIIQGRRVHFQFMDEFLRQLRYLSPGTNPCG